MRGYRVGPFAAISALLLAACTPNLTPPRESTRISGVVKDLPTADKPRPTGVMVYESCSSQLLVFQKCPGKFLGEAKLARPGKFVVEVDTQAPEVRVFAFRGYLTQEEACGDVTAPSRQAARIEVQLTEGPCSVNLTHP